VTATRIGHREPPREATESGRVANSIRRRVHMSFGSRKQMIGRPDESAEMVSVG
jgi:hypothetical protein